MNKRKGEPASDDADLFQQALEDVVPLKPSDRIAPTATPRPAVVRERNASATISDKLSDHDTGIDTLTEFRRNGISPMTLRKLRRGQYPIQDSLDLHGLSSEAARKLLQEFLQQATRRGLRCVNIIHGKGWHTQGGEGILKHRARNWLVQCEPVLAFCEAPPLAGGSGAVWVLLKTGSLDKSG